MMFEFEFTEENECYVIDLDVADVVLDVCFV